jgi:hypothetical protein
MELSDATLGILGIELSGGQLLREKILLFIGGRASGPPSTTGETPALLASEQGASNDSVAPCATAFLMRSGGA